MKTRKWAVLGIVAIIAIGFVFTACSGDDEAAAVAVVSVSLNKGSIVLTVGASETLTATVEPTNASDKTVSWSSSDPSKATVNNNGKVEAKAEGTATITVTTKDGNKTATCNVTVSPAVAVTGVTLNEETLELEEGDAGVLTATIEPATATNKNVSWDTSDATVATVSPGVDGTATVNAIGEGTATITVTTEDGDFEAECEVTVTAADPNAVAVTGVTLAPTTLNLTVGGATGTLTATVAPETATNKKVSWSISPAGFATVSGDAETGIATVTAVAEGDATITVTTQNGRKTATCSVSVTTGGPGPVDVINVTVAPTTLNLTVGGSAGPLTATVTPEGANQNVIWSSGDSAKVSVSNGPTEEDPTAPVAGTVTAVAAGVNITITATTVGKKSDGTSATATCSVTVTAPSPVPVTSVTLDKTALFIFAPGVKTIPLTATVLPENAANKAVTWSTSNAAVANVVAGTVTAGSTAGTATITVTSSGDNTKKATCAVTVKSTSNGLEIEGMKWIESGTFTMGSPETEVGHYDYYEPEFTDEIQHEVTLTQGFYMSKYQVTHAEFEAVMGFNPSYFLEEDPADYGLDIDNWDDCPIDSVSWYDALVYCNKMSEKAGLTPAYTLTDIGYYSNPGTIGEATVEINWNANGYRLPTEAEWEFACRAGTTTPFYTGETILSSFAIYDDESWWLPPIGVEYGDANFDGSWALYGDVEEREYIGVPVPIGLHPANPWGLYDMHGNMEDWCWDWYDADCYADGAAQTDPKGPEGPVEDIEGNIRKVCRGGSWWCYASEVRSAYRASSWNPGNPFVTNGFRLVLPYSDEVESISPKISGPKVKRSGTAKIQTQTQERRVLREGVRVDKNSAISPVKPKVLRRKVFFE
jgi:uncharacterized protein YjdB